MAEGARPTVGVIGLGHIGGSLALAVPGCIAWSRSEETRAAAAAAGVDVVGSVDELVAGADIVVLATALPALEPVLDQVAAAVADLPRSPTITDVGSVKAPIAAHAARVLPDPSAFVPGHPLAGTERSGWASADGSLFDGTTWALSVDEPAALDRWFDVAALLCGLGVEVVPVASEEHDRTLALTSHLPYLLAGLFARRVDPQALALSGGSLAGLTRVVSTTDGARFGGELNAANHDAVAAEIDRLVEALDEVRNELRGSDPTRVAACIGALPSIELGPPSSLEGADRQALLDLGRRGGRVLAVGDGGRLTVQEPSG
jgi:prephenate dehydrogenase